MTSAARSDFLREWARLRSRPGFASREEIGGLLASSASPRERLLVAAVEIESGARSGDDGMFGVGVDRFRSGLHEEQMEVLRCFTDLAILGSPDRRRSLLRDVWVRELGANDPAVRILASPSRATATALLQKSEATRLGSLESGLGQELKRELSWLSLDEYLTRRDPVWLELLRSPLVTLGPNAAGYWEYELIRALTELALGRTSDAAGRIGRLLSIHATGTWRSSSVRRAVVAYSPLAAPRAEIWADLLRSSGHLMPSEASSPREEAGAYMMIGASGTWSSQASESVLTLLETRPSDQFLFFLQFARAPFALELAQLLLECARDPAEFAALPWPGRENDFADACRAVPVDVGLALLEAASEIVSTPQLQRAVVEALEGASASGLDSIDRDRLTGLFSGHAGSLSRGTRAMLSRDLVYRAVVDGSNVVLAGVHNRDRYGAFHYYEQLLVELRAAGFREIITYFDASLRHGFPRNDWSKIERLEAKREAMVVRGVADVHVISEFLKAPDSSWIVTNDDYKDHVDHFPDLGRYWFKHRLHFHVSQRDQLVWDRPLDSPDLPRGAPQRPKPPLRSAR